MPEPGTLRALYAPESIAVIGASNDKLKFGGRPIDYMAGTGYAGHLYPVNPRGGEIMGLPVPGRILPGWVLAAWAQLSTAAAWFTGREPDVTPEGNALSSHEIRCVSDKAERELGYRSVPVRLMVEDTIAWMKSRGLLQ